MSKKAIINISSEGTKPYQNQKRQLGKINFGLYCINCNEFFAQMVVEPKDEEKAILLEFKSDGEPLFECPFCHTQQRRQVSEIAQIRLTERSKRKPPAPTHYH